MNMMIPLSEFQQRRQQLLQQLEATGTKAVAVVAAAQLQTRSRDTECPFRQDSDFYYLTGFNEPNALLVLAPHAEHPVQLFCQPNDALAETWQGRRLGIERAVAELGVDYCASIDDVHTHLIKLLDGVERVYHHHQHDALTHQLHAVAAELRTAPKRGFQAPVGWIDLQPWLADMRMIKSANELNVMREAARISVLGHQRAMRFAQPTVMNTKWQLKSITSLRCTERWLRPTIRFVAVVKMRVFCTTPTIVRSCKTVNCCSLTLVRNIKGMPVILREPFRSMVALLPINAISITWC